jgi:ECF transporter S component (folate family)
MAVSIVISNFFIPLGDNLKVFFTFLPKAVYCAIGGPLVGLAAGFAEDIIGYLIHPLGGYFFGYTLSSMLGCFIFGLFFYQTKISLPRIIIAKTVVNYFVNVALGCLWSSMMVGQAYMYYLTKSLIKNTILLPIEIIILSVAFASLHVMGKRSK